MQSDHTDDSLEARARRRLGRKMGLFIHATVFVLVNLGLFAISAVNGDPHWARGPLIGWGLGLAIHGLVTLIGPQGEGLQRRMLQREIDSLRRDEA